MTRALQLGCAAVYGAMCRRRASPRSKPPLGLHGFCSAGAVWPVARWNDSVPSHGDGSRCQALSPDAAGRNLGRRNIRFGRPADGPAATGWAGVRNLSASAKKARQGTGSPTQGSDADMPPPDEMAELDEDLANEEEEYDTDEDFDGPVTNTGDISWSYRYASYRGETSLEIAQKVLAGPEMTGLSLYSLVAVPPSKILRIRLDKLNDEYGSPSLEDITSFSKAIGEELERALGEDMAGSLEVEVSSPGAERVLRMPEELERFKNLPLLVEYDLDGEIDAKVLRLLEYDAAAEVTTWGLADVALNKLGKKKGQGLNRKERDMVFNIPVSDIRIARVHLDV